MKISREFKRKERVLGVPYDFLVCDFTVNLCIHGSHISDSCCNFSNAESSFLVHPNQDRRRKI